jgi:putative N-acetylmannosamine-6-phosphate epimerase
VTVYDVVHITNRAGFDAAERACKNKMRRRVIARYAIAEPDQLRHFAEVGARSVVIDGNVTLTAEQSAMVNGLMARAKQPTEAA